MDRAPGDSYAAALSDEDAGVSDRVMSDIDKLQSRITAAMDRIAKGVEAAKDKPPAPDPETLRAMEDARTGTALRQANEEGVGEPHLSNTAMLAELEGLRAARASDIAEADAILSALTPLVKDAQAADTPATAEKESD